MPRTNTVDVAGELISQTIDPTKVTVQYSRKLGRENYGNEELGVFVPVTLEDGVTEAEMEKEIVAAIAFAKTLVLNGLGREANVSEDGSVADTVDAEKPKAAAKTYPKKAASGTPSTTSAAPTEIADLWDELLEFGDKRWFDNRVGKRNPNAPDFKRKGAKGELTPGLWLNDKTPAKVFLVYPKPEAA